jgi:hypothetical protein
MALDVEWALSRLSALLLNSLACSRSGCLNFNALGALVAQPNRLQNLYILANVTKPLDLCVVVEQHNAAAAGRETIQPVKKKRT